MIKTLQGLKYFLVLWSTQSLSHLGSSMTAFGLTLWLYERTGSALETALLSVCTYAPYVAMSIFAGALSDRWDKKKTMLACDAFAAATTVATLVLLQTDALAPWHLYLLNGINGLMNTVQQPAGDVAMTLVIPKSQYQRTSGLRYFSNALVSILNPILATAIYSFLGIYGVICIDLFTFAVAFLALLFWVKLPPIPQTEGKGGSLLAEAKAGLRFLRQQKTVLHLILFLAGVNFVASAFETVLPAFVLGKTRGNAMVLGLVSAFAGIGSLAGSLSATLLPKPKDRVRVIYLTMLFSLGTENLILSLSDLPVLWCAAEFLGWCLVPVMGANLDVILRTSVPVSLQGRVYACRNTLQFFTIPLGRIFSGLLTDRFTTPLMTGLSADSLLVRCFGSAKGGGAALTIFLLWVLGVAICLIFGRILRRCTFREA